LRSQRQLAYRSGKVGPPDAGKTDGPVSHIEIVGREVHFAGQLERRLHRSNWRAAGNAIPVLT
jgi:hypothetical protein